jgi:hypothetical protein
MINHFRYFIIRNEFYETSDTLEEAIIALLSDSARVDRSRLYCIIEFKDNIYNQTYFYNNHTIVSDNGYVVNPKSFYQTNKITKLLICDTYHLPQSTTDRFTSSSNSISNPIIDPILEPLRSVTEPIKKETVETKEKPVIRSRFNSMFEKNKKKFDDKKGETKIEPTMSKARFDYPDHYDITNQLKDARDKTKENSKKLRMYEADKIAYFAISRDIREGKLDPKMIPDMFIDKYLIFELLVSKNEIIMNNNNNNEKECRIFNNIYEDSYQDEEDKTVYVPHNWSYMTKDEQIKFSNKHNMNIEDIDGQFSTQNENIFTNKKSTYNTEFNDKAKFVDNDDDNIQTYSENSIDYHNTTIRKDDNNESNYSEESDSDDNIAEEHKNIISFMDE